LESFLSYLEKSPVGVDSVRPGEQWFCYWKTSAALWESRILQTSPQEIIFVPIYWGFHAEGNQSWDFGRVQAERDLSRLAALMTQHGRNFCWLLPLSPSPFLPNGGVPAFAARTLSINENGLHLGVLDQEEKLHKMYSYFEPKVFQSFVDFTNELGAFLVNQQIKAPVWGSRFYYQEEDRNISYLEDYSVAFEKSFSRYLKKNVQESFDLSDPKQEESLKLKFISEAGNLFKTAAESALAPVWAGTQNISVLGGSPSDTIERVLEVGKSQLSFVNDLFNHYVHDRWISSILLSSREKKELLPGILNEHFGSSEIERRYQYKSSYPDLSNEWRSFGLIDIFTDEEESLKESGLENFLESKFRWMYSIQKDLNFSTDWIEDNQHKLKIFKASNLNRTMFGQMMKLFLMGQKIVLDKAGLAPELENRLQVFFLENNLKTQTVNFFTTVHLCELGEGRFITYDSSKLTPDASLKFWPQLFNYFNLNHLDLKLAEDVFGIWRIRSATPSDLNYLDVRRINLYNPTSYKKAVTIKTKNGFAFMKMIDPLNASAKSHPHGVEIELLPQGRIALDFGHYEEVK
jgi:hypothetical protein